MKRTEEPLDPDILAQLDAIDATLAGEPVDPEHAEIAELALLLAADRPAVQAEFAARLDEQVDRRFAPRRAPDGAPRRRSWSFGPLAGLASAAVAAVVVVVVLSSGPNGSPTAVTETSAATTAESSAAAARPSRGSVSRAAASGAAASTAGAATSTAAPGRTPGGQASATPTADQVGPAASPLAPAPKPPANGRKIVQSAQLSLNATPGRIDTVAQELFDVVGRENGVVNNSTVTAASDGYAQFQLSIPSANLPDAMTALSQLRYAHVAARTDSTQDVNGQYVSAGRRLADDRALRTSLLRQLAKAATQTQINSLNAQIHDAESAIARDEAAVRSLNNRVNYSHVEVTVNGSVVPVAHGHSSSGFTLGQAAHDAGRVLTVAAGVALITLAALVPLLLVGALAWWIASAARRRRREQALDLA